MSCSKPLPPFNYDVLYYLNRDQLEHFSIVCRPLKNYIDRYFDSKPYRVFHELYIRGGGSYSLRHNKVQCHPSVEFCSFAEMHPYLGQTVRIVKTLINVSNGITYNPEHIEQMESIAHLWCNGKICIWKGGSGIVADDIQIILNSPTILQCRHLFMIRAHFSFKDYKVLYNAKIIENYYGGEETDPDYWPEFLEQPGVKPLVVLLYLHRENINTVLDYISKTFSSAILPNAFKIVFAQNYEPLTEFRMTNETSGEKLELKKGLPIDYQIPTVYQNKNFDEYYNYTLERSSI